LDSIDFFLSFFLLDHFLSTEIDKKLLK